MNNPSDQSYSELLSNIQLEWNKAEAAIKSAEIVSHDVIVPSINELRYAGRRIVDALQKKATGGRGEEIEALLNDAIFDCRRARYDAVDAATSVVSLNVELLVQNVGYDTLLSAAPDFRDFFEKLQRLREKIVTTRQQRERRDSIYSDIETADLPQMLGEYERLRGLESVLKSIARKRRWELLISRMTGVAGLVVGLLGALLALFH
jgi:hypothetical protein